MKQVSDPVNSRSANLLPVTVVVPTRNEEQNLAACLERLGRFAAVVVIDSGSTDATCAIAAAHGAKVLSFEWDGRYPKKRNWFLINHPPQTEWVLFLDADEFVDDRFVNALERALTDSTIAGYWLSYTNYFLGARLDHGVEQRKLALFRTGHALYERIEEHDWSDLDMEIHEHPLVDGPTATIHERIEHHDQRGILKFIDRHRNYALWEAARVHDVRRQIAEGGTTWEQFTPRQRTKYRHIDKWWYAWAYFLFDYGAKRGFLDGRAGFAYAAYKLWYYATIRLLMRDKLR